MQSKVALYRSRALAIVGDHCKGCVLLSYGGSSARNLKIGAVLLREEDRPVFSGANESPVHMARDDASCMRIILSKAGLISD